MIRPTRSGLVQDTVLFDRLGNFLGPVTEVTGVLGTLRYVIRRPEDSVAQLRGLFKIGDQVFYYNCDRLHPGPDELSRELNLIELKRQNRGLRQKKQGGMKGQIMNGVIKNLRELKLDLTSKIAEEYLEDDERSSRNSRTMISMVMNSHCNQSLVGSAKERQKRKKYKKAKEQMFYNQNSDHRFADSTSNYNKNSQMEDELTLGKRCNLNNCPSKFKADLSVKRSTDYSRRSTDTDPKWFAEDDPLFKSISMTEEGMIVTSNFSVNNEAPDASKMNEETIKIHDSNIERIISEN